MFVLPTTSTLRRTDPCSQQARSGGVCLSVIVEVLSDRVGSEEGGEMQESRELWMLLAEYRLLVDLVRNGRAPMPVSPTNLSATERTLWAKGLVDVMSDFIEPTRLGRAAVAASHRVIENSAVVFDIAELERAASLLP